MVSCQFEYESGAGDSADCGGFGRAYRNRDGSWYGGELIARNVDGVLIRAWVDAGSVFFDKDPSGVSNASVCSSHLEDFEWQHILHLAVHRLPCTDRHQCCRKAGLELKSCFDVGVLA